MFKHIRRKNIQFDYSIADYHTNETDHIEHHKVEAILRNNAKVVSEKKYLINRTHIWNPMKLIYKWIYGYDTTLWVAKK